MTSTLQRSCINCGGSMEGKKSSAAACSVACNNAVLMARRKAAKWDGVDPDRPCESCGNPLTGKRPHARFCNRTCKTNGWAAANRETQRERDRARYPREAEQRRAYAIQYLKDNPERMRAVRRRRKGQLRAETLLFTEKDWTRLVARYRGCCAYCGEKPDVLHREHVIPLARGGRHSIGNILPACPPCNYRKKTKLLSEWRYRARGALGGVA